MIGDRIFYLREQRGYSQQEVADALCVERSTYVYYEIGKINPSISQLKKLSDIFNISVDELVK